MTVVNSIVHLLVSNEFAPRTYHVHDGRIVESYVTISEAKSNGLYFSVLGANRRWYGL